jgi:hypothetical protein
MKAKTISDTLDMARDLYDKDELTSIIVIYCDADGLVTFAADCVTGLEAQGLLVHASRRLPDA